MKSVAVVGAGIAGLRVAQLLENKGHSVIVYEARERVGGRLHTVQSSPGFYEAGGEWIDADHARVIGLLNEFGLEPEPTDPRPRWLHFCEDNAWSNDAWPVAAMATEALWEAVPDVRSGARSYKSLGDVLDDVCKEPLSRAYCEAVALSDEGTDSSQVDARAWAEFFEMYEERTSENEEMSAYRFPGGAQALCEEMAGTLKHPVASRKTLQNVATDSKSVRLSFLDGSTSAHDACVLTIPPTCLKDVRIPIETKPWEQVVMSPTCKVVLQFETPFWEDLAWGGSLMSDLDVQQVWPGGRSGLCLLTCYVNGEKSRLVCGQADPVRYALDSLARLFPGIERSFVGGTLHDWFSDPYAGGGFPVVPPGSGFRPPVVTTGDPRIVLAGDWTAHWMGFIEGALESAERAAEALTVG